MWYIFRHGETFYNVKNDTITGRMKNVFLTPNGVLQTYMNAKKLLNTGENFSTYKFIHSPLERTRHTCQILLDTMGFDFNSGIEEELLLEGARGDFEGLKKNYISEKYGEELSQLQNNKWSYSPVENYETNKMVFLRVTKFLNKYKNEKNLVIVTHETICKKLISLLQTHINFDKLEDYINGLTVEEGEKLNNTFLGHFDQNYFCSWDGNFVNMI